MKKKLLSKMFILVMCSLIVCGAVITVIYNDFRNSGGIGTETLAVSNTEHGVALRTVLLILLLMITTVLFISFLLQYRHAHSVIYKNEVLDMMLRSVNTGLAVLRYDDKSIVSIDENLCRMLGYERDEIIRVSEGKMTNIIHQDDVSRVLDEMYHFFKKGNKYDCEYRLRKKDGGYIWVRDSGKRYTENGVVKLNCVLIDITENKTAMDKLKYQANYDGLTGIYNRVAFYKATEEMLSKSDNDKKYAIVQMDISQFKIINEYFGTYIGDLILKEIGKVLSKEFRGKGTFGRLESDHFAFCVCVDDFHVEQLTEKLQKAIESLNVNYNVLINFGVYEINDKKLKVEKMCDRANLALDTVIGSYMDRCAYYNDKMRCKLVDEQNIVNDMSNALLNNQFEIYLQPQYNHSNGYLVGAEVLVRWKHPERGMISPGLFIPIFEKNGFITKLDVYVWELACKAIAEWRAKKIDYVPISINISRIDIGNPHLCEILNGLVEKYKIDHSDLRLEITESAYVDNPMQVADAVAQLKKSGFFIEMDDFGSGYSSLNTLKDVPVDMLKLDLKFLSDSGATGKGGSILNSIIRMSRWLNLYVIAEGVETRKQADYLQSIGCSLIQGYFYSKPIPLKEYEKLLNNSNVHLSICSDEFISMIDENSFWNADSQSTLLFNHFVGPAGIFEYHDGNIETLRVNDQFYNEIGVSSSRYDAVRLDISEYIYPMDKYLLKNAVDSVISNCEEKILCCRWFTSEPKNEYVKLKIRIRLIAKTKSRFAILALVDNVSATADGEVGMCG